MVWAQWFARKMRFSWQWRMGVAVCVCFWTASLMANANEPLDEADGPPSFMDIADAVRRHFVAQRHRKPNDIISRSEAEEVLAYLRRMGWTVERGNAILKRVPDDRDYLVKQLRSPKGVKFMRRVSHLPQAYDRMERLSSISGGRRILSDLIRGAGGHEMIEYLSTSQGGRNLGKMLAKTKGGSNLNRPTGNIYTPEQLVKALRIAYDEEQKAAQAEAEAEEEDAEEEEDDNESDEDDE